MKRSVSYGFAAALFALLIACGTAPATQIAGTPAGPTGAPAAAPTAQAVSAPGKVGDAVVGDSTSLTVSKVTRADAIGQFQKAQAGSTFVIAEVIIENVGADKVPYNPLYFTIKDADGFEYSATISTDPQALKTGELAKGEKARGTVAIEVKEAAKGLVLQYKPIQFGNVQPIRVDLGM